MLGIELKPARRADWIRREIGNDLFYAPPNLRIYQLWVGWEFWDHLEEIE